MKSKCRSIFIMIMLFIIISPCIMASQQLPELAWINKAGGKRFDCGEDIAVDNDGNCYIIGTFQGSSGFGIQGEPGYTVLEAVSSHHDTVFIVKLDAEGDFLWARKAGGHLNNSGNGIAIDQDGNCYITGRFTNEAHFGEPGEEGYTYLVSNGSADIYISKLDADGNFQWARRTGGPGLDYEFYYPETGMAIAADSSGNVYVTGEFLGLSDFGDPGSPGYTLLESSYRDVFITKLDTDGNFLWARKAGGEGFDRGCAIALDQERNCYVAGLCGSPADFGEPGEEGYTQINGAGSFITKIDKYGNFIWTKPLPGVYPCGIAQDNSGNSYVTGIFFGRAEFGEPGEPGYTELNATGDTGGLDCYIAKIDNGGNFIWARKAGGSGHDKVYDITADAEGNSYISGTFDRYAEFGQPGEEGYTLLLSDWQYRHFYPDIFWSKLDTDGNFHWARKAGGSSNDYGMGISAGPDQSVYATGAFMCTAFFGFMSEPGYRQIPAGCQDIFLARLVPAQECPEASDAMIKVEDMVYYPESPMPGDTIHIDANVHNTGYQNIESGNISFYCSTEPNLGLNLIETVSFSMIEPGGHVEISSEWTTDPDTDPLLYFITACVTDIAPCDTDYSNNQITRELYSTVEFDSFTARGFGNKAVIGWTTLNEINILGFNLYRITARRNSPFMPFIPVKINDYIVLSAGNSLTPYNYPISYSFDDHIDPDKSYIYILEYVSISGISYEFIKTRMNRIF